MSAADPDPLAGRFGATSVAPDERRQRIRDVFRLVAPRYDLMNDLMSFGIHRPWKRAFVAGLAVTPGLRAVDLAGGTGDIARLLAARGADVTVVDPSEEMLAVGRRRSPGIAAIAAEAEHLPFADASLDLVTMSFGIRNVTHMGAALAEIGRVLKPGGRFACLEFSTPHWLIRPGYQLWSRTAIPTLGALVAGKVEAYRYLIESIERFPDQARFAGLIRDAGFAQADWRNLSFGIAAIHVARKA